MTELVILAILGAGAVAFGSQDLGLRTWVAGSRWSWSLWPVLPLKIFVAGSATENAPRTSSDGRTDTHTICNYSG